MRAHWFCWLALAGCASAQVPAVAFETDGVVLAGDPIRIAATAAPGTEAELELSMLDRWGRTWSSTARFRVPKDGRIDLGRDATIEGSSYDGVDPLGPFWSMRLRREVDSVEAPGEGHAEDLQVTLRVASGEPATARLRRWLRVPGVSVIEVGDDGLVAKLFVPPGSGARPAVVVVGDANGGMRGQELFAELLASRGYVALALAYFDAGELPADLQNIPLEYFDRAIDWLEAHPVVDVDRLGVLGGSKGGELALLLASRDPRLRAVVAISPSGVVFQGIPSRPRASSWMAGGEPLPFIGYASDSRFGESGLLVDLYSASLDAASPEELARAAILVENICGPVLLLAGQRDHMWPASRMAREVRDRLRRHDHPFAVELLDFADAGHEVGGPGWGPASVARSMGGTRRGKAYALAEGWQRTLGFLERSLGSGPGVERR